MKEERVSFTSQGLRLSGVLHVPDDTRPGERLPCFIVLHGFGSNKESGNVMKPAAWLVGQGYGAFRFDMRGCGESEGERGHLLCLDQVENTLSAITVLQGRAEIDAARIALIGSSFGAAVAVYAGGVDRRVAAVVSSGGWGHGERKFRGQHPTEEAWRKFAAMLEEGKRHRARTGASLMVPRYDIVPIPPHLRANLSKNSVEQFTAETAQGMNDFRAEDVVGDIAPRPLLLLHSSFDSVTPTEQSIEMFKRAAAPVELHLMADTDHFMFNEDNVRVFTILREWLARYFPARAS